jgi:Na+/glutamate symporter
MPAALKKALVIVSSVVGGFCLMFCVWALFTFRSLQVDLTDPYFWLFLAAFSFPVYAVLNRKLLMKPKRYKQFRNDDLEAR